MRNLSNEQQQNMMPANPGEAIKLPKHEAPNSAMLPEQGDGTQSMSSTTADPAGAPKDPGTTKASPKDPTTVEDYIESFLSGKSRSFSEEQARKIAKGPGHSPSMSPESRENLLRLAREADSLDKARQLMQFARLTGPYRALGRAFREFSRDLTCLHPVIQGVLPRDEIFPGSSDGPSLSYVWEKLFPLETRQAPGKKHKLAKPGGASKGTSKESGGLDEQSTQGNERSESLVSKEFAKARRNAFLCAALWRHGEGLISTSDFIGGLKQTIYSVGGLPDPLDGKLVDALVSLPEKEAEKLALYMEWSTSQLAQERTKSSDLELQLSRLRENVSGLQSQLDAERESHAVTVTRAEDAENAWNSARADLGTQRIHSRANFEGLRATSLSIINQAVNELNNVEIVLTRPVPKTDFAADVVKNVIDELEAHIRELEAKK